MAFDESLPIKSITYNGVEIPFGANAIYTADANATSNDMLATKTAYVNNQKITGTIPTKTASNITTNGANISVPSGYYAEDISKSVAVATQATPSITVSNSGLITASATQTAGYVSAGTKSATKQLTTKGETTYFIGSTDQTIAAGTYLTGTQTIKGVSLQEKSVVPKGTSEEVTPDSTYNGLSKVTVAAIPSDYIGSDIAQKSSVDLTVNGATVTVPAGYYDTNASKTVAAGSITLNAPTVSASGLITASGTVSAGYINSNPSNQTLQLTTQAAKTITPTKSSQTAVAKNVYTTGIISVAAIPSQYVDTTNIEKTSADLTTSGATVNVPAGYYATNASKAVATGSISVNTPSINTSTGVITASTTLTTAGYVATNPSSKTLNLTTQAAKTITPTASEQTAVSSGVYTTGEIKVAAVPTETKTVSENGTYTPTSGKYFSSVAVSIPIQKYYTGSSTPASSLGSNGDLYLKA